MRRIVWLASYPKSGNTWMRFLLANLFYPQFAPMPLNKIGALMPGDGQPSMFEKATGKPTSELTEAEIHAARSAVQKQFTEMGRTMFVKTHSANIKEGLSWHIDPVYTEGAILVVRDPRDVACSMTKHFGVSHYRAVEMLCDHENVLGDDGTHHIWNRTLDWSRHTLTWTAALKERCCVVRYEDLHAEPLSALRKVCDWAGLDLSDKAILTAVEQSSFDQLKKAERKEGFLEVSRKAKKAGSGFFQKGQVGRWKDELEPKLSLKLEKVHGEVMGELGYT